MIGSIFIHKRGINQTISDHQVTVKAKLACKKGRYDILLIAEGISRV